MRVSSIMDRLNDLLGNETNEISTSNQELDKPSCELESRVARITRSIGKIRCNIDMLETTYADHLISVGDNNLTTNLDTLVTNTYKLINEVKENLEKLKIYDVKTTEDRIANNMHNMLLRKFMSVIKSFQEVQRKYKEKQIEKMRKQITILYPKVTKDEIDSIISSIIV
eukprot:Pompholyxophrys_sp_v1_NODE_1_length_32789_cov_6.460653.p25 type:complete len:169 gc:universal NODE_1_length_32789_cov_6.460653:23870-24376(+)